MEALRSFAMNLTKKLPSIAKNTLEVYCAKCRFHKEKTKTKYHGFSFLDSYIYIHSQFILISRRRKNQKTNISSVKHYVFFLYCPFIPSIPLDWIQVQLNFTAFYTHYNLFSSITNIWLLRQSIDIDIAWIYKWGQLNRDLWEFTVAIHIEQKYWKLQKIQLLQRCAVIQNENIICAENWG